MIYGTSISSLKVVSLFLSPLIALLVHKSHKWSTFLDLLADTIHTLVHYTLLVFVNIFLRFKCGGDVSYSIRLEKILGFAFFY